VLKNNPLFKGLQHKLSKLERDYQAANEKLRIEQEAAAGLRKKHLQNIIKTKISKALHDDSGKPVMLGLDLLVDNLIYENKVTVKDDGETVVFLNGDEEFNFADGIGKLKTDRKDLLINAQHSGSGSGDSGGRGNAGPESDTDRLKRLRAMKSTLAM
jgi:hypothetical protein